MCGINAIVAPSAGRFVDALARMNKRLAHRGPDGEGAHVFANCLLGHRRLSIVDLAGSPQPMLDATGTRGVTFNGEIYGYKEIRAALDYPFRTKGDTEVLLALYDKYGQEMMPHVPGMFAFAIWDDTSQTLFAARDRFGEKPLFYAEAPGGSLVISSELKGLLASGLFEPEIDRASLAHYLHFGFSPRGRTIYRGIYSLPPAHVLTYRDGRVEIRRYWDFPVARERVDEEEAIEEFRALFARAVRLQLVADVEVAAFLSGGLDSSSVVRAASRIQSGLRTISYGFEEPYSELPYAAEVARHCGTRHQELRDAEQHLPDLVLRMADVYDEPFFDSSAIPTWLICRRAAEHVKVVLTGDGGDEVMGGYNFWYKPIIAMHERYPHRTAWRDIAFIAARLAQRAGVRHPELDLFTRLYGMRRAAGPVPRAHAYQQRVFSPARYTAWELPPADLSVADRFPDEPGSMFRLDMEHYMPGDILVKTDRASMAHGLELRAPFLDVKVAEFCLSLPYNILIRKNVDKYILRSAMRSELPDRVFNRQKQGFGAPLSDWMVRCKDLIEMYLYDRSRALFTHLRGLTPRQVRAFGDREKWCLLILSLWLEGRKGREA
jgi:asparagine synthase (glutamine-hydrolysing)